VTQILTAVTMLCVILAGSVVMFSQTSLRLNEVLVVTVVEPKPGSDPAAIEAAALKQLTGPRLAGVQMHLVRKDRGNRAGRFMIVGLGPRAGATAVQAAVRQATPANLNADVRDVEYQLVGGDTLGALPEVDVLGIHYIRVRPDRIAAFDAFVARSLHPVVGTLSPDLRLIYYKPVRGDEPGNYITVFALTRASRDKYWPGGKDSDALRTTFQPAQKLRDELQSYLVEGSYATGNLVAAVFESRQWADWVIVSP